MAGNTYTVRPGDTLSGIAIRNGTTVANLVRINGIRNPNNLKVDQVLHLRAEEALAVEPLFLDAARNPIEGLNYRLQCGSNTVQGTSQTNGLGQPIVTQTPNDQVSIWVQLPWKNNHWAQVAQVESGTGKQRVTMTSPAIRIKAPLSPHPLDHFGQPASESATASGHAKPRPTGTSSQGSGTVQSEIAKGSGKGIHSRPATDEKGITRQVLSQDLPDLRKYFDLYTGEKITEQDYSRAADVLNCEVAVIKAFAKVESGGNGFDDKLRPKILYERHKFSQHTDRVYDTLNAELSSRTPYTNKRKDSHGDAIATIDRYNGGQRGDDVSWQRFMKAWQLGGSVTEDAAVMACSWGMFQVLGENCSALGIETKKQFMEIACTSERDQFMSLFVPFIQTKRSKAHGTLKDALTAKNWDVMALLYNGKNYKKFKYDKQLKDAYEDFIKSV